MSNSYNKYYIKENYFGNPYTGLISYFKDFEPKGTVLDLGCGQGRDSIALGKLGYKVTGVDSSSVGIAQLNDTALKLKINVTGVVGDIFRYPELAGFDIVLMDSMLHFYKNDIEKETGLVNKIINEMKADGVFCNCMIKGSKREKRLKSIIDSSSYAFDELLEEHMDYPDYNAIYHVYIVKKMSEEK